MSVLQLYPPARVKYTLQVKAAQTVCENQASVNLTDCALQSNAEVRMNRSEVLNCVVMHFKENGIFF